jgi:hypothetical protein
VLKRKRQEPPILESSNIYYLYFAFPSQCRKSRANYNEENVFLRTASY